MCSLIRFTIYQNFVNKRCILILQRDANIDRCIRSYCSRKDEIIDKLDAIEQKMQNVVQRKTKVCLESKCKHDDTTLPDCKPCRSTPPPGRKDPGDPIPEVCGKPPGPDRCIRPFVNPCPPFEVKPCTPYFRPVDPCRGPCKRPRAKFEEDLGPSELSIRTKKILLALTTLLAFIIIYKAMTDIEDIQPTKVKRKVQKRFKMPKEPPKVPAYSVELPNFVPYVIVGGGPAAYSALQTITSMDEDAKILVINKEPYFPYDRTPLNSQFHFGDPYLSKQLLYYPKNSVKKKSIFFEKETFYSPIKKLYATDEPGTVVSVARGWTVQKVDSDKKFVQLEDGMKIKYDKCILATGSSPRKMRVFTDNSEEVQEKVTSYSTIYDFHVLEEIIKAHGKDFSVAIVGGGRNATELACSLKNRAINVVQIFKESGPMHDILPNYLSEWLNKKIMSLGVTVLKKTEVLDAMIWKGREHHGSIALYVDCGHKDQNFLIFVDHVIVASGNVPNTELAEPSAIEVDKKRGGFMVNRELQVRKDLYAAGDCISFFDGKYGRRHIEHYEHAIETGKLAAENVMGEGKPFDLQTRLWSDVMPQLGYEAVGVIDSTLPTVGVYINKDESKLEKITDDPNILNHPCQKKLEDFYKGAVFYLKNDTVVGILTWNVFERAALIRNILQKDTKYKDVDDMAKFLHLHM